MILDNRRITIREVADDIGISFGLCHVIFTDVLDMKRAAAKTFTKLLNFDQLQCRMDNAQEMLTTFNDKPKLLKKAITGDESWVYGYDIGNKVQSSQWKRPRAKTEKTTSSSVKCKGFVFFDCNGVVHHEFLPQGRTINKEYILEVICRFRETIR